MVKITPPLYMIGKKIHCWRCESKMTVIALMSLHGDDSDSEICILSDITEIPKKVLSHIQKRVPTFKLRDSKMAGHKYFGNTCPKCGVLTGEFFLHSEPGAPFFPTNAEEASSLYLTEIPLSKSIEIRTSLATGVGNLILNNAKKV